MRSERSIEEGSGTEQRGGIPGVVSNLSNDPKALAQQEGATEQNSRRESVKNFEISRAVTRSAQARGKVVRLSTAVLVDGKVAETPEIDGEGKTTGKTNKSYEALTPEMLSQVESIVKSAVGFDSTRGDVVTVENVPFFAPDESLQAELAKAYQTDQYLKFGGMMVPVFALALFVLFVLRPLVKFLTTTSKQEYDLSRLLPNELINADQPAAGQMAKLDAPESEEQGAAQTKGSAEEKKSGLSDIEPAIDIEQFEEVLAENQRLVKENPQQAALLIRYWLNDGRI
jgi:flagellar M-ring protein FliF